MTRDDVEMIERETPFRGYFRMDRYRLRHRLYDGGWSAPIQREVLERGHAVAVIPYDPGLDRVVLIEQFRVGVYAAAAALPWLPAETSPWILETPAGIIDEGEEPEDVARRETLEEAGCAVADLELALRIFASPGVSSETITVYLGRVDASAAGGTAGLAHEHEDIRVLSVSAEEAFRWLDEGRFTNATAYAALAWFRHNRPRYRELWRTGGGRPAQREPSPTVPGA
jgi:ADP-ribose pyrophosphatase